MGRYAVDTQEMHDLSDAFASDANELNEIRLDLVAIWSRAPFVPASLAGPRYASSGVQNEIGDLNQRIRLTSVALERESEEALAREQGRSVNIGYADGTVALEKLVFGASWNTFRRRGEAAARWSMPSWVTGIRSAVSTGSPYDRLGAAVQGVGAAAGRLGEASDFARWIGTGKGAPDSLKSNSGTLTKSSNVLGAVGVFASGIAVVTEVGQHRYVDAGVDAGIAVASTEAGALKKSTNPVAYLAGAALQTASDDATSAKLVDWSAHGLHQIVHASAADWAGSFISAEEKLPVRVWNAFTRWQLPL